MRLVLSWLKEFVDIDASADDVAGRLGLRGFEVASVEALADGDAVIDFEITANRPDCLSVLGLAREVATAFDRPLRLPSADADARVRLAALPVAGPGGVRVTIEDEELCPRYAALVAEVALGSSPAWLAARLEAAGVRPISTIVDVTNYVNLEIGQPMHAFDHARLAGAEIRVRRAKAGETIRTLDGVNRTLDPDMLVIADRDRAQAIAGVMGGADSEVPDADVVRILTHLGLGVTPTSDGWDVVVPLFRVDLLREADLIEEVGRHHGFDRLAPTFPPVTVPAPPPDPRTSRDQLVRRILT